MFIWNCLFNILTHLHGLNRSQTIFSEIEIKFTYISIRLKNDSATAKTITFKWKKRETIFLLSITFVRFNYINDKWLWRLGCKETKITRSMEQYQWFPNPRIRAGKAKFCVFLTYLIFWEYFQSCSLFLN